MPTIGKSKRRRNWLAVPSLLICSCSPHVNSEIASDIFIKNIDLFYYANREIVRCKMDRIIVDRHNSDSEICHDGKTLPRDIEDRMSKIGVVYIMVYWHNRDGARSPDEIVYWMSRSGIAGDGNAQGISWEEHRPLHIDTPHNGITYKIIDKNMSNWYYKSIN